MRGLFAAIVAGVFLYSIPVLSGNHAGTGALIGGGVGIGTGLVADGIAFLVISAAKTACESDPCTVGDGATTTYVAIPLTMGAVGAGIGALIGASIRRDDSVAITPIIRMDRQKNTSGGLLVSKRF